jgi:hypothetical protein
LIALPYQTKEKAMNALRLVSTKTMATATAIGCLCALAAMPSGAQTSGQRELTYNVTSADRAAVKSAISVQPHARPVKGPDGLPVRIGLLPPGHTQAVTAASALEAQSSPSAPVRYPADLTFQGGPVVTSAQHHAIYMRPNGTCPISACWGNPEGMLRDLSRSNFIHITDQYVGTSTHNRYPVGQHASVSFTPPFNFTPPAVPLTDADVQAVVHAVAAGMEKTGYGNIYHVFLPQGTDECFDSTFSTCYSPDNSSTFAFCAYHGYVDFADIGHVLYSVEPFQNVAGCNDPPGTPNGQLVDSTNDTLSHESFETITDPDLDAWWNNGGNLSLGGQEIGDECVFIAFSGNNVYGDPGLFTVDERTYAVQPEYDNARHACAMAP